MTGGMAEGGKVGAGAERGGSGAGEVAGGGEQGSLRWLSIRRPCTWRGGHLVQAGHRDRWESASCFRRRREKGGL